MCLLRYQAALQLLEDANAMVLPTDTMVQAEKATREAMEQTQRMLDRGSPLPRRRT